MLESFHHAIENNKILFLQINCFDNMIWPLLSTLSSSFGGFWAVAGPTEDLHNRKNSFLIFAKNWFWWHDLSTLNHFIKLDEWFCAVACVTAACMLHSEALRLGAPAAAQNHEMSSMRWLKVVRSCYQNNYFAKIEKQFFRFHDGIIPACCILKGCCGRLQLHKTTKWARWGG